MLRLSRRSQVWVGGSGLVSSLGIDPRSADGLSINVTDRVMRGAIPQEALKLRGQRHRSNKWELNLRADIYEELTRLPLRYAMHPFHVLQEKAEASAVGYFDPLGSADPHDVIPFFVHRNANGRLPGKVRSLHAKISFPVFFMDIQRVEGDLFRFEDELIKIFPTKKTFVRPHTVLMFSAGVDAKVLLHHWLLGLGF